MAIISEQNRIRMQSWSPFVGGVLGLLLLGYVARPETVAGVGGALALLLLTSLWAGRGVWAHTVPLRRAVGLAAGCANASILPMLVFPAERMSMSCSYSWLILSALPGFLAAWWMGGIAQGRYPALPRLCWAVGVLLPCVQGIGGVVTWGTPPALWGVQVGHAATWWLLSLWALFADHAHAPARQGED